MRPQRPLADAQCNVGRSNGHDGALRILHWMDCLERCHELHGIDLQLCPPALKAGLRFCHAILDRLDAVAVRKRAPGSYPETLQDGVGIDEDRSLMASHRTSQLNRGRNPMRRKEVGEIVNCQVQ